MTQIDPEYTGPGPHASNASSASDLSAASEDRAGEIRTRYAETMSRVADAAVRSGRRPEQVIVAAVTKYAEPDDIRVLYDLGHRDFGESRVPQLVQRATMFEEIDRRRHVLGSTEASAESGARSGGRASGRVGGESARPVRWHMIGHLQRNKARRVIEHTRLIHSLDTLRLAEELQNFGLRRETPIEVLIQVNVADEPQKYGCAIPAVMPLVEQIDSMVFVRARGLMCMAPYSENPEDSRLTFSRARELFEEVRKTGIEDGAFNILSMGMSGDFEVAIEEGANLVRVGSSIFGDRPPQDDDEQRTAVENSDDVQATASPGYDDDHAGD
jgi:pyridoxal phosphate enzyme (YggS family)